MHGETTRGWNLGRARRWSDDQLAPLERSANDSLRVSATPAPVAVRASVSMQPLGAAGTAVALESVKGTR